MFWNTLFHRPQSLTLRKFLFQFHLWVGIGVGLYIFVVGTTGAALVFRGEMQQVLYPNFFPATVQDTSHADISKVVENMAAAHPEHELVGVGSPTDEQHAFVGYIFESENETYRAVFADSATGEVIGTFPEQSVLLWLQNLHFYLLAGTTGLFLNGIGGLFLALMCLTGLAIWWPGVRDWRRGLKIDFGRSWKRINWDLHNTVGVWTLAFVLMWAVTGAYFAFPQQVRDAVSWFSPVTSSPVVVSDAALKGREAAPDLRSLVANAEQRLPGSQVARVSLPTTDLGTVQVVMTRTTPRIRENADYVYFYFDQFSGKLLYRRDLARRTAGDLFMPWIGRLHVGAFGPVAVKIAWLLMGLTPMLLFVTGVLIWWNRVLSPRLREAWSKPSADPAPREPAVGEG